MSLVLQNETFLGALKRSKKCDFPVNDIFKVFKYLKELIKCSKVQINWHSFKFDSQQVTSSFFK